MDKNLQDIVENVVNGILNGAYDYDDFDRNIEFKLAHVIRKYAKNADGEEIVTQEFMDALKKIRDEVNSNWKVKKHNAYIDTIRKLRLGTKKYYDFYEHFYDEDNMEGMINEKI